MGFAVDEATGLPVIGNRREPSSGRLLAVDAPR